MESAGFECEPRIPEELQQQQDVRVMGRKVGIEFRGNALHCREIHPGDSRQIVVLIVVSDVEGHKIKRPIVTVGSLGWVGDHMFGHPACT